MTTHTHPEIQSHIRQLSNDLNSHFAASVNKLLAVLAHAKAKLKSDIAEVTSKIANLMQLGKGGKGQVSRG